MSDARIATVVKAPVMIPGRKKSSARPERIASTVASRVPKSPERAYFSGRRPSSLHPTMRRATAAPDQAAGVTPANAFTVTKTTGGRMPSAIPLLPEMIDLSSSRTSDSIAMALAESTASIVVPEGGPLLDLTLLEL